MSSEDKMPLRRENTLAPLEKVPEELMDQVVEHAEAKRVADLPIIDRVKEGIEDVTTQISSSLKEAVTSSNTENQEENKKQTQEGQEKPEKKESPKAQKKSNDPNLDLKHKLESGEKIKASELASEFIHFIQEESRGSDDQNPKKQEQKGEHQSFVHIAEEGVKTIVRRLSQTIEDMKEKLHSSREGSAGSPEEQHPHHHSLKEFALDFVHEIKDDMTLEYDQEYMHTTKPHSKTLEKKLEKFIPHKKPQVETAAEAQPSKADEIASIHQVNPAELKGFTTVQSGKSETKPQQEEKETKKEEEQNLLSSSKNPFDILMEDENLNVVAGEGIGADITNKAQEIESTSFKEKAKGKIENVSSKISQKAHAAKSKVSATFKEADKENAPQVA